MKLLRSACCYKSGSGQRNKRRRRRGSGSASDRDSVSGSEEASASVAVANSRRGAGNGGSKRRQRATYRYEVVYRREEFSHDYLDQHHHHRPLPEAAKEPEQQPPPRPPPKPLALLHQSTASAGDYSLLSNYGQIDNVWPLRSTTDQVDNHHQPLYQNAGINSTYSFFPHVKT